MRNKLPENIYRKPLILALLISLFLEITLFNYTHYATLFTSEHFNLEYNKLEKRFNGDHQILTKGISVQGSFLLPEEQSELVFVDVNAKIASIYIDPIFLNENEYKKQRYERVFQKVKIIWADEANSAHYIEATIIKGLDFSNYININPRGKVSYLTIVFVENNIAIKQIEFNKEIPMVIMPIRLIIVFGISLLLLCLKNAETRKKISYFCFDYLYDKTNFKQRLCFIMLICSMLIFNLLVSYSIYGFRDNELAPKLVRIYSHFMTDALLKKQLHLDVEVPKVLLETERPYDFRNRKNLGIVPSSRAYTDTSENIIFSDLSLYKGKFYSYFGMVPVIVLFAPYKLITGDYLPNSMGAFLFASIATILLMLLWKQIAQNYLKKLPYFFFLIGGATLYASSLIPIVLTLHFFHIIAQYSALAFVLFGVIMLLQAKENGAINRTPTLLISSFSFALAVACRPTALFWSILIPVMLWDKRKELINTAGNLLAITIPFVIVGSILARYNYARFDSPFEFGMAYQLVNMNLTMMNQISIIGKIHYLVEEFLFALFNPPNLDIAFPFISAKETNIQLAKNSFAFTSGPLVGIFCFPIMWFLFSVKKVNILRNFIFAGISISLLNIAICALITNTTSWRYTMDFAWIMALGALICAFQKQDLKAFYSCSGITLLSVFFLTISYRVNIGNLLENMLDPKIYYYLARTFGVICNVPVF